MIGERTAPLGQLEGKIKAGIPPGARFDDFTFKGRFTGLVQLSDATYVTGRPPLIRDTGNSEHGRTAEL